MQITMEWLKLKSACKEGCVWFNNQKETDAVKVLKALIKEDKLDWANWTIVRVMDYKQYVSYAIYAAEQVIEIYEKEHPYDNQPRLAIKAAKKCIENPSKENKDATWDAWAAWAARATAGNAGAAWDATGAAWDAAWVARIAAGNAAWDTWATGAAWAATGAAIWTAMQFKILNYGLELLKEPKASGFISSSR